MLPLLDDLVVDVAEFRGAGRQGERELEEPALERVLELRSDPHLGGNEVEPQARPRGGRLGPIPGRRAERAVRRQLPARVLGIDAQLRRLPVDVGVSVEVLPGRLMTSSAENARACLAARRGETLL